MTMRTDNPRYEYQHAWYLKNKVKCLARSKKWQAENREREQERQKKYTKIRLTAYPTVKHRLNARRRLVTSLKRDKTARASK